MLAGAPTSAAQVSGFELQRAADAKTVRVEPGAPALHIVFFAIWCPPCVDELRALGELDARWSERGYRLVLIAVQTRHTRERLASFAAGRELPGELLFDVNGRAQAALRAEQLPTHIVIDSSGKEVLRAGGVDEGVAQAVEGLLKTRRSGGKQP